MTKRHAMFHYTEKQKSLKIQKWQSEAVNLKTEKKKQSQAMVHKSIHKK